MHKTFSNDSLDLLKKLLTKNANDRISAKNALMHPWLTDEHES